MWSLLVVLGVAAVVYSWVNGTRRHRLVWLSKLDLPGVWQQSGGDARLELNGELNAGPFVLAEEGAEDAPNRGRWVLEGHMLRLTFDSGKEPQLYDLTLFSPGHIGLKAGNGTQRAFKKNKDNVVPLRTNKH